MESTASKPTPSSPAHLLWDWADAAAPGSSGEAAGRRGKEKRAKVAVGEEGSGGGGGGGGGNARCQVEGCGVELRAAKEYHRKHRVCEAHTKSPRVVVAGQERRFCQQCSRWVFLTFRVCSPESCSCTLFGSSPELRFSRPSGCSLFKGSQARTFLRLLLRDFACASHSWNFRSAELQQARTYSLNSPDSLNQDASRYAIIACLVGWLIRASFCLLCISQSWCFSLLVTSSSYGLFPDLGSEDASFPWL
jgi:hypothetical protein